MKTLSQLLTEYAQHIKQDADTVVKNQAGELLNDIQDGWPVDTGYSRAEWQGPYRVGYAHYRVENNADYAPVIEYGGYPGVGPKTEEVGSHVLPGGITVNGGIYPSQRPAAPVRRALSKRWLVLSEAMSKVLRQ